MLIQSSTQDATISIPRMISWDKIELPNEWLLENVSKPAQVMSVSTDDNIIKQYLNGDVKINFADLNSFNRIQRPLALDTGRKSFAGFATTEGFRNRDKEIDDLLADANKLKMKGIANDPANSQISSAFYSTKTHPPTCKEDDDSGSISPSASNMNDPLPPLPPPQQIHHQLRVLDIETHGKNFFSQIDWPALYTEFSSKEKSKFTTCLSCQIL